ncbi:MAG: outer membrane beta-barrel protein [Gammaproteobacteria bacterium]|nr:outer membrane beta-barrel protein [Gammaproteobacteria bacterium]
MVRIIALVLTAVMVCACAPGKVLRMTASGKIVCSDNDYKDSDVFDGSTDDDCGFGLIGRIGHGIPFTETQDADGPVGSTRPNNTMEFELGYLRQGDTEFDGLYQGTPDEGTIEADGLVLGLVYTRRISDKFDLFANYGIFDWEVEEEEEFGGIPESHDASGSSPYYGFGGRYWFMPKVSLRLGWNRFTDVGKSSETGKGDIDNWSLGVDYLF